MTGIRLCFAVAFLLPAALLRAADPVGDFADHTDIGKPAHAGAVIYDAAKRTYLVTGGGKNMWGREDAFHFVWKQMSGDVALAADIRWIGAGKEPHRKACLIIRQSLAADSAYADAALHGDGLTSLQCREEAGDRTYEVRSNVNRPARIRVEKQGDRVFMSIARAGEPLRHSGGSFRLRLTEPFYVGLGVCAHDDALVEKAEFTDIQLSNEKLRLAAKPQVDSTLEVVDIASKDRRVIHQAAGVIEAPNWTPDGRSFLFNARGRIYRLPSDGGEPQLVDTGFADRCNNDHGLSPDGKQLAISHHGKDRKSRVYVLPVAGGVPKELTPAGPSYWHGWSPDGKTIVYCAERNGEFDIYAVPAAGGEERRLTDAKGLDDGPEYSPDGKYIYFNSDRTGRMQIWRMKPDGGEQEQVTSDDYNNWFPHPSPDGKWLVFLSFDKSVEGHPANKDVLLRLRPIADGPVQVLARVFGGQGTINVPSWSPDSRRVAFVSYLLVGVTDDKGNDTGKKRQGRFTIGKDTTYVTGPLDKDGYIDYVAALNDRLRQGVTPENNANVLLWKALGPTPAGERMPPEYFQWLGIPEPPANGEYFIDLSHFVKERLGIDTREEADKVNEQLARNTQRTWTAKEHPHLAAWLKANEKPLALVVEATRRSHYYSPLVPGNTGKGKSSLIEALLPAVQKCRELANALAARAMMRAGQGAWDDAWEDLVACHRLGRLAARGGTLIELLVGFAIDAVACRADLAFLHRTRPDAKRIERCLRDLQELPPLAELADKVALTERFVYLESAQTMAREGTQQLNKLFGGGQPNKAIPPAQRIPQGINWDLALRNGNRWYDGLAAALREKDRDKRQMEFDRIAAHLKTLEEKKADALKELAAVFAGGIPTAQAVDKAVGDIVGKAIGDVLLTLFLPAADRLQQAADRNAQIHSNLHLAFALAWYQRDHGRYPDKLDALAPKYLRQVPQDTFSGKALIYRPSANGYLLYSVGVNGKDDGGQGYGDEPAGDDLSVRMPLAEPRRK